MTTKFENKIQSHEMKFLRRLERWQGAERIRNQNIRDRGKARIYFWEEGSTEFLDFCE